jgi:hypothetical protein
MPKVSRQEPPNIVHCHDQKLDLSVFKGSFWGWFVPVTLVAICQIHIAPAMGARSP